MRIFLVRHAESKANALKVHGSKEVSLSDNGIRQAEAVARSFVGMDIDLIMCSKYKREMQTAKIIREAVGKRIIYTDLLGEWKWPSEMQGVSTKGDARIWDEMYDKAGNRSWHYSDAENLSEVAERAKKVLDRITSRKEESIIVVTHGAFMGVLLGVCISGEDFTGKELRKFTRFFRPMNTGITELMVDKEGIVRLVAFNDYAHLR